MLRMGLREANQHFSLALRVIRRGEEVVLTERGRPIAVIRPIRPAVTPEEAEVRRLEAEGVLLPALRRGPMGPFRPRPVRGAPLSRTLALERRGRL